MGARLALGCLKGTPMKETAGVFTLGTFLVNTPRGDLEDTLQTHCVEEVLFQSET